MTSYFKIKFPKFIYMDFYLIAFGGVQYEKCVLALNRGDRRRLNDQWGENHQKKYEGLKHIFTYYPLNLKREYKDHHIGSAGP